MTGPNSRFQKSVLDAIYTLYAKLGRSPTLTEVAAVVKKAPSTVHRHARNLRLQGLLDSDTALRPGDGQFGQGWRKGITYAASEAERVMIEHHAEAPLIKAVKGAMTDAISAQEG